MVSRGLRGELHYTARTIKGDKFFEQHNELKYNTPATDASMEERIKEKMAQIKIQEENDLIEKIARERIVLEKRQQEHELKLKQNEINKENVYKWVHEYVDKALSENDYEMIKLLMHDINYLEYKKCGQNLWGDYNSPPISPEIASRRMKYPIQPGPCILCNSLTPLMRLKAIHGCSCSWLSYSSLIEFVNTTNDRWLQKIKMEKEEEKNKKENEFYTQTCIWLESLSLENFIDKYISHINSTHFIITPSTRGIPEEDLIKGKLISSAYENELARRKLNNLSHSALMMLRRAS